MFGISENYTIFPKPPKSDYLNGFYIYGISEMETAYGDNNEEIHRRYTEGGVILLAPAFVVIYLISIVGLKNWMRERARFALTTPLLFWNVSLAIFSVLGALRSVQETTDILRGHGVVGAVCNNRCYGGPSAIWMALMAYSKVVEMGDTMFILARKQKLIFLHWYHHAATMLYCWLCLADSAAPGRIFMLMNYTVHSLMYSYYAGRAVKVPIPRAVSALITSLQLLQMFVGFSVVIAAWLIKRSDEDVCDVSYFNLTVACVMYFSYIILFANFFYCSYIRKGSTSNLPKKMASEVRPANIDMGKNRESNVSSPPNKVTFENGISSGEVRKRYR